MVISAAKEVPKTQTEHGAVGLDRFPKKDLIYVVAALHDTDHGVRETVIQATRNPYEAVETARDVERLGYQFFGEETGVRVYFLEIGQQYNKSLFDLSNRGKQSINYPILFRRYKLNGEWQEEWFNETMKFIMGLH